MNRSLFLHVTERLEGLVGPEFPSEPPPSILGERDAQLGVDPLSIVSTAVSRFLDAIKPASGSSAAPQPPPARAAAPTQQSAESLPEAERKVPVVAWTAAASSVPALRGRRRDHAQVVPDAVEPWEDAEDEPAALRPPAPARSPAPSRPRSNPALLKLGEIAKGGVAAFSRWPRSMKIGAGQPFWWPRSGSGS